jgi:hypothetical protein
MNCNSCQLSCIGQTGRNFKTRYKEHIESIRANKPNSKYAQHAYGPITDIMNVLYIEKKGQLMNTWERCHIYILSRDNLQMNDTYTDIHNLIFNLIKTNVMAKISISSHPPSPLPPTTPLPHSLPHHNKK